MNKCQKCGRPTMETYCVLYQDSELRRRLAYGMGIYCPSCHAFHLKENLGDTRLERAGNED